MTKYFVFWDDSTKKVGVVDYRRLPFGLSYGVTTGEAIAPPIKFDPANGVKVREAEGGGEGYWVGGATVFYEREAGYFWLTYRWRNPTDRGYKLVIARSTDGINFTDVWSALKGDFQYGSNVGCDSLERASLIKNPVTGKWQLFFCADNLDGSGVFKIYKLADVNDPTDFDPATAELVLDVGAAGEWDEDKVNVVHQIEWSPLALIGEKETRTYWLQFITNVPLSKLMPVSIVAVPSKVFIISESIIAISLKLSSMLSIIAVLLSKCL